MPDEIVQEHLLEHKWTLYFRSTEQKSNNTNWAEQQKIIFNAETVEQFWRGWVDHLKNPRNQCDYSLFKDGIQPMWEDPRNAKGGRWLYQHESKGSRQSLDQIWLDILLLMIGENFEPYNDNVCGAVLSIRSRGSRLAIWTSDASEEKYYRSIGEIIKKNALKGGGSITYAKHDDGQRKGNLLAL